ncbi:hypothetical protein WA171_003425, partial [Blastocystis sp. BT1]
MNRYLLVVNPGLERLLISEIKSLVARINEKVNHIVLIKGGAELDLPLEDALCIASQSRLLESIRIRVGSFYASQWYQLENGVNHLSLPTSRTFCPQVHITSHQSHLYHTEAIKERILKTRLFKSRVDPSSVSIPFYFLFHHDYCTVSMEIGGFYKRGYRRFVSKTPLRETLAAALGYSVLWRMKESDCVIIDPFCGSGTILQEFYSFVRNDSPTLQRKRLISDYKELYEQIPEFASCRISATTDRWNHLHNCQFQGFDIDLSVIECAKKNTHILDSGAEESIHFKQMELKKTIEYVTYSQTKRIVLLSNPPYGYKSKSSNASLVSLYHDLIEWIRSLQSQNRLTAASILIPSFIYDHHLPSAFRSTVRDCIPISNHGLH